MGSRPTRAVQIRMATVKRRFELWRRTREGRGRIPEALWDAAVSAVSVHGVHKTARTLRLNYASLNQRVERSHRSARRTHEPPPRFVEMAPMPIGSASECVVEVEDARGTKLRIHLKGASTTDLPSLARALWESDR